ncbi:PREDICTED: testis-specific serine/threonine-protein kinase 3 [Nanorana parkeri]|uniref:testis-specific serine/threonine-protein kinase 3 n=1 Tax=Nanorana parkeri TaxID=125878 RepID=UPI0008549FB4|nr:PREDICTED: testis-specific serine/threonine-protein kinase 3 [Nanorana parkeri]
MDDKKILLLNRYQLSKTIGKGTYSKVKEAYSAAMQKKVAIKIIAKTEAPTDFIQNFLPRELHIVRSLRHKNIIEVYKIIESVAQNKVYMIMELAEGGDILDYIGQHGAFPEARARTLFHQLAEAVDYLHDKGVTHRDIKCENVLLHHGTLKLSDFGFAKTLSSSKNELSNTFCGSAPYTAPEVLQAKPYDCWKSDIWSMGVVLYVMISARLPFSNTITKILEQQQKGITLPAHIHISEHCKDLVKKLLQPNIDLRPSIKEVTAHPWLNIH